MNVAAYIPDLMDRSRLGGVKNVTFVKLVEELENVDAELVIVDLSSDVAFDFAASGSLVNRRVVAFASHVDTERIAAAKASGINEVLPRSRFFSRIVEICSQ